MDNTTVHPSSKSLAHCIDLHLWRGAPKNLDEERPIEVLVNHGFVVGFCPERLQPAWSAYRVAFARDAADYERPLVYYDDMRLPQEHRIGRGTFGKLGGIQLNVGHMTPNEVINRQYGRLAQMETFLMSNMSPQYGSLNSGVWLKLETAIREIKDEQGKDHVWAIVGPVFGEAPTAIGRGQGKHLPVPDSYFCVLVDPHTYPFDTQSRVALDCFMIPQNAPRDTSPADYPATLEEVEQATKLKFFDGWGREPAFNQLALGQQAAPIPSRIAIALEAQRIEELRIAATPPTAQEHGGIPGLIEELKSDANRIRTQGRALTQEELTQLHSIQYAISYLVRAQNLLDDVQPETPPTLITYKIVSDMGDKLQRGARTACNFWNRFVQPKHSIVIRLGTFTRNNLTIARAYEPYTNDGTLYGAVEFNTKYLVDFSDEQIAGTIVHELGHTLGIGWDDWRTLFDAADGLFNSTAIAKLSALQFMEVERDGGGGTALAHWDELRFDNELMTGFKNVGEIVLPVTIDVMSLLGHEVVERLTAPTPLSELLHVAQSTVFSQQAAATSLDLDHYEVTRVFEEIPHA